MFPYSASFRKARFECFLIPPAYRKARFECFLILPTNRSAGFECSLFLRKGLRELDCARHVSTRVRRSGKNIFKIILILSLNSEFLTKLDDNVVVSNA